MQSPRIIWISDRNSLTEIGTSFFPMRGFHQYSLPPNPKHPTSIKFLCSALYSQLVYCGDIAHRIVLWEKRSFFLIWWQFQIWFQVHLVISKQYQIPLWSSFWYDPPFVGLCKRHSSTRKPRLFRTFVWATKLTANSLIVHLWFRWNLVSFFVLDNI